MTLGNRCILVKATGGSVPTWEWIVAHLIWLQTSLNLQQRTRLGLHSAANARVDFRMKLAMTMSYLAQSSGFQATASLFGVSKATAIIAVNSVMDILQKLAPKVINVRYTSFKSSINWIINSCQIRLNNGEQLQMDSKKSVVILKLQALLMVQLLKLNVQGNTRGERNRFVFSWIDWTNLLIEIIAGIVGRTFLQSICKQLWTVEPDSWITLFALDRAATKISGPCRR